MCPWCKDSITHFNQFTGKTGMRMVKAWKGGNINFKLHKTCQGLKKFCLITQETQNIVMILQKVFVKMFQKYFTTIFLWELFNLLHIFSISISIVVKSTIVNIFPRDLIWYTAWPPPPLANTFFSQNCIKCFESGGLDTQSVG